MPPTWKKIGDVFKGKKRRDIGDVGPSPVHSQILPASTRNPDTIRNIPGVESQHSNEIEAGHRLEDAVTEVSLIEPQRTKGKNTGSTPTTEHANNARDNVRDTCDQKVRGTKHQDQHDLVKNRAQHSLKPGKLEFQGLWEEAYEKLRKDEGKLIEKYERYLLASRKSDQSEKTDEHQLKVRFIIRDLADQKIKEIGDKQVLLRVGGEIEVAKAAGRDIAQRIVHGIMKTKDVISAAIVSEPHAALFWAGVLVVLPVFLNLVSQDEKAIQGLNTISELVIRCHYMEESLLNSLNETGNSRTTQDLHKHLRTNIIHMYSMILNYQICVTRHYSKSKVFQSVNNIVVRNDWDGMLRNISTIHTNIIQSLDHKQRDTVKKIDQKMTYLQADIERGLQEIHSDIKEARDLQLLDRLDAIKNAGFNAQAQGGIQCFPDTQKSILRQIQSWIDEPDGPPIFWLHGMAGTGKSTIARTVASKIHNKERFDGTEPWSRETLLGASFFFKQADPNRNHPGKLFPTLASDLVYSLPDLHHPVCTAIRNNASIADQWLRDQWTKLILTPLEELQEKVYPCPTIVIILDALDECKATSDNKQTSNIAILLDTLGQLKKLNALKVRVLLTSRPTPDIERRFKGHHSYDEETLQKVAVSNTDDTDIHLYLRHELANIRNEHDLEGDWPGPVNLQRLVIKVDGLFIYAATVCRFLNEPGFADDPNDRLAMVFNNEMGADSPQENIDRLYVEILNVGLRGNKHKVELFKYIIGSIVVLHHQLSPRILARLVYPAVEESEIQVQWAKVSNCLSRLHSFLDIPEDSENNQNPIQLLHLSFRDFLLDDSRYDGDFHIDDKKAHGELFKRCIEIMQYYLRGKNICQLEHVATRAHEVQATQLDKYLPGHAQYACCHWMYHLEKSDICDGDSLLDFLRDCFTHWVEAMSLMKKTAEGIPMLDALRNYTSHETYKPFMELRGFVEDATRFLNAFRSTIEEAPLQVYVSALLFAPRKSVVRQYFAEDIPGWIVRHPNVAERWGTLLHMLHDNHKIFCCCGFSPSGDYMASGSLTGAIHLWDVSTWQCQQVLEGQGAIEVVTFVSESLLASASIDGTICLWCLDTSHSKVLKFEEVLDTLVRSPDGKKIAFGSQVSESIYLYDLETEVLSQKIDAIRISTLCFSPDSIMMAFGRDDNNVELWDTAQNRFLRSFEIVKPVQLAFSPNGNLLYGLSRYGTVISWNVMTGDTCICISHDDNNGYDKYGMSAFSPDTRYIAIVRHSKLYLRNLLTGEETTCALAIDLNLHIGFTSIVWTPKGKQVAVTDMNYIHIWDLATHTTVKTILNPRFTPLHKLQISPDERFMIKCGNSFMCIWDLTLDTSDDADELHGESVSRLAFSPHRDRNLVVTDCGNQELQFWKTDTGDLVRTVHLPDDMSILLSNRMSYGALALFSANGKRLLYGRVSGSITIWDVTTWELLTNLPCTLSYPVVATISRDGNLVVAANVDGVELWDVETGGRKMIINHEISLPPLDVSSPGYMRRWNLFCGRMGGKQASPEKRTPTCAAISTKGGHLAVGYSDASVAIFGFHTGKLIHYLPQTTYFYTMASSAGLLALAGDSIKIIELATGKELGHVSVHQPITQLAFSEDGSWLNTEWGRFQIDAVINNLSPESKLSSVGSYYDDNWIWHGGQQIILVPHGYKPYGHEYFPNTFNQDGILAVGSDSGKVFVIELEGSDIGTLR